jgi:acyl-coenzyme A thioesterase PaaI-like protein
VPYLGFMGIGFDRRGDELTAVLTYDDKLIGNPLLPALHGGATASFLEVSAIMELSFQMLWDEIESGELDVEALTPETLPRLPKTIDFTVDYLRSGLPRDAYARARVNRSGGAMHQRPRGGVAGQPPEALRAGHGAFPDAAPRRGAVSERRRARGAAQPPPRPEDRPADRAVERDGAASGDRGYRRRGAAGRPGADRGRGLGAVILSSVYWVFGFLRMGTVGLPRRRWAQATGRRSRRC